jgi:hypothetical protein
MSKNKSVKSDQSSDGVAKFSGGLPRSSLFIPMPPVKPPQGSNTKSSSDGNQEKGGGQANTST